MLCDEYDKEKKVLDKKIGRLEDLIGSLRGSAKGIYRTLLQNVNVAMITQSDAVGELLEFLESESIAKDTPKNETYGLVMNPNIDEMPTDKMLLVETSNRKIQNSLGGLKS